MTPITYYPDESIKTTARGIEMRKSFMAAILDLCAFHESNGDYKYADAVFSEFNV